MYTAVRVRPPLQPSDPGFDLIPQRFQRSMVHVASPTSISVDSPQGRKLFIFDQVFGEDAQQEKVWDYLHDSVDAFIQGFNVSVLAYGQSGSGKSYTMGTSGPAEQSNSHLMGQSIPFQAPCCRQSYHHTARMSKTLNHCTQASFLEQPQLYSISWRDLLHCAVMVPLASERRPAIPQHHHQPCPVWLERTRMRIGS